MVRQRFITHPNTGETLCKKDWAEKVGVTSNVLHKRIQKYSLEVALTPGHLSSGKNPWSKEEEEYLCDVCRSPNLYRRWNRLAKIRGWNQRSRYAIKDKISRLQGIGLLDNRRLLDESSGWLTITQLADCMGVSYDPVKLWLSLGLKGTRDGNKPSSPCKIHLKDFVSWACTPSGAGLVGKAIYQNVIASTWLLVQIGNWMPKALVSKN